MPPKNSDKNTVLLTISFNHPTRQFKVTLKQYRVRYVTEAAGEKKYFQNKVQYFKHKNRPELRTNLSFKQPYWYLTYLLYSIP